MHFLPSQEKKGIIETTAERSEGTNKFPHASKMTRTDPYKTISKLTLTRNETMLYSALSDIR